MDHIFDVTDQTTAQEYHEQISKKIKEGICKNNRRQDLVPKLTVSFDDGCIFGADVPVHQHTRVAVEVADAVIPILSHHGGTLMWLGLSMDGYVKAFEKDDKAGVRKLSHGDLQAEYSSDPATDVVEAIITTCAWRESDGTTHQSTSYSSYHHTDGGRLVWDGKQECQVNDDDSEGEVPKTLRAIIEEAVDL